MADIKKYALLFSRVKMRNKPFCMLQRGSLCGSCLSFCGRTWFEQPWGEVAGRDGFKHFYVSEYWTNTCSVIKPAPFGLALYCRSAWDILTLFKRKCCFGSWQACPHPSSFRSSRERGSQRSRDGTGEVPWDSHWAGIHLLGDFSC